MKKTGWMLLLVLVLTLAGRPDAAKAADAQWVFNEEYQTWMYVDSIVDEEPEASDIYVDHWIEYQDRWYHFLTGWQYVSGKWYYLVTPNTGGMYHDDIRWIDEEMYSFSKSGAMHHDCWVKEIQTNGDGSTTTLWHYAKSSGKLAKGWLKIKDVWYYFTEDGERQMVTDQAIQSDEKWYYFDKTGAMQTDGWNLGRRRGSDMVWEEVWYYAGADGSLLMGWNKISGKWYYFYETTAQMACNEIVTLRGKAYAFGASGAMKTGWVKFETEDFFGTYTVWVYAKSSGELLSGWQEIGGKTYYFEEKSYLMLAGGGYLFSDDAVYVFADSGALITKSGWTKAGGEWYYLQKDHTAVTEWQTIGGKQYYFYPGYGFMVTGLILIDGKLERFSDSGAHTETVKKDAGWFRDGEDWYYFVEGAPCTGWREIGGKTYYFDPQFGYMYTGAAHVAFNDRGYFFYSDGSLATTAGWKKMTFDDGGVLWFYTYENGTCYESWNTINGKEYYFDPDYYFMYAGGSYLIDGHIYSFDDSGARIY